MVSKFITVIITKIWKEKNLERKIFMEGKCYIILNIEGGGGGFGGLSLDNQVVRNNPILFV